MAFPRQHEKQPARTGNRFGSRAQPSPRPALTLVEVVVSTLIVGVMTVAALNTLGAATRSSESFGDRAIALGLADDLMAEILQAPYNDPNDDPQFGPEGSESDGPRAVFDDVDDYNGWDCQPPQQRDGTPLTDREGWRTRIKVQRVDPEDPSQVLLGNTDTGAKRIHVFVDYDGTTLVEQIAVRTNHE